MLVFMNGLAQQQELVDVFSANSYAGKSYIYTGSVTLGPNFTVSASTQGSFFIKPAEAIKSPPNVPPTQNENFVRLENILVNGVSNEDQISGLNNSQRSVAYQYMDGAGRTIQNVTVKNSPAGYDVVTPVVYDANGRTPITYFPYVSTGTNGAIKPSPLSSQSSFYNGADGIPDDDRPFQEYDFELSSLSRIKKMYGAGELWKNSSVNKGAEASSQINSENTVRRWFVNPSNGLPESSSCYTQGALLVSISISEEGNVSKSYSDFMGNVVMTESNGLQTYYVYNLLGQLAFILPPLLSKDYPISIPLTHAQPSQTSLDILAFQYKYDGRQRLSLEKRPGADNDWIYYVYDQWDRLVSKQDGAQRQKSPKEWSFIKYDGLNRPIITGILKTTISTHQGMIDAVTGGRFETENSSATGYTLTASFPSPNQTGISSLDILAITYYDDYSFLSNTGWAVKQDQYSRNTGITNESSLQLLSTPKGMVTGSKIKGGATNTWYPATFYYDNKYRVVLSIKQEGFHAKTDGSSSASNTADRIVSIYDFAGKILESYRTTPSASIKERFEYDHAGRIKKAFHAINGNEILLAAYNYNELGQVIEKNLHSTNAGSSFLQSIDYRYNIRGWLTSINNSQLSNDGITNNDTDDLFGMNLVYNQETLTGVDGTNSTPLYDGRITAARWMSKDLKTTSKERAFTYFYDSKLRFNEGRYAAKNGSAWTDESGFYNVNVPQYDENGNIKQLKRHINANGTKTLVDDLTYSYTSNGNELTTVEDIAPSATKKFGYPDATSGISPELQYDKNGNLTSDLNSVITAVTYNYFNLPEKITIDVANTSNDNFIEFAYDGSGYLTKKIYKRGTETVRTIYYDHGIQYIDGPSSLIIYTPEGRATLNNMTGGFEYEYFIKDQLSNTRVVFGNLHSTDVFKATMEPENATKEESDFRNVAARRTYSGTVNTTPSTPSLLTPDHTALVKAHAISTANTIGPAKMLAVAQGERLNLSANAISISGTGGNSSIISGIGAIVANSFNIVASGETQTLYEAFQNAVPALSAGITSGTLVPKAYLCYIIFNSNYTSWQFGYHAIDNSAFNQWQALSVDVTVPYNGFAFVYVANESTVSECYFDDVRIVHHKPSSSLVVTEVNDYDPYGMVLEGTGYVDESRLANNYKYQGQFAEFESLTGWSRFEGRGNYDSRLGRWHSVDPANQFASGYIGMGNNPVIYPDPDGRVVPLLAAVVGGAAIGAYQTQQAGGEWWKGAIVGGLSGAAGFFAPAGILPGLAYGAGTGAMIGGINAALNDKDVGKGALQGGLAGGLSGAFNGYNTARRAGGNIWTGKVTHEFVPQANAIQPGDPLPYDQQTLHDFFNKKFGARRVWVTMKHRPKDYTVNANGSWAGKHGKNVYGITRPSIWGGYKVGNVKIYIARAAFNSEADLFVTLGHELTHVQNFLEPNLLKLYQNGDNYGYTNFDDMTERAAWDYVQDAAIQNQWNGWYQAARFKLYSPQYPYPVPSTFLSRVNKTF